MSDYEKEQDRLIALWNEVLSADESDFSPIVSEYEPSDSSDSDDPVTPKKKNKILNTQQIQELRPSTSSIENVDETPKSSTSNNIDDIIESVIAQNIDYNDDDTDFSEHHIETNLMWGPVTGNYLKNISLTLNDSGIHSHIYNLYQKIPYDFYKMMITDEIFQLFVNETNNWKNTTQEEMEKFIGCLMWMGLLQLPSIRDYWSKKCLYENSLKNVLPKNRFQILLKTWHFANNENANTDDRLNKISQLLPKLQQSFQAPIIPGEFICIDETLVPFKGRLKFKQYISNKRFKFGIKLFKLCLEGEYLYDFKVYCGQERDPAEEHTVPFQSENSSAAAYVSFTPLYLRQSFMLKKDKANATSTERGIRVEILIVMHHI
ncbi:hypothetical protein NQ314_013783 [Rhamnusium bicolor]|uniref:PiggyBac transposable element-derived protein domain-containing protein n=1 Tax=Rhamnusium bicolor TaxID=1586634 RepID=A0AAV8X5K4_9CUCU|nr:hypothetical protein NQ314_013783 [Rhamnusium bicolor]